MNVAEALYNIYLALGGEPYEEPTKLYAGVLITAISELLNESGDDGIEEETGQG